MRRRLTLGAVAAMLGVWILQAPAGAQEPERPAFADWLSGVREEALARGIRPEIVEQALGEIQEPLPVVLERDRTQAEIVLPLETYVARRLTRKVITAGRQQYGAHRPLLEAIEAQYGVPGRVIVAIWGVESNYGRFSGVRPTVAALATLAWDPRRATFFRGELFNALEILNRGDIEFANMKGSWAGAMGQPQFMPSSYLQYAADHDGDGRRDIWASRPDVFASIANYLKGHGWTPDQRWGREVKLSAEVASRITRDIARREGTCRATREMTVPLPLEEWTRLGVRAADGSPLPHADLSASLVSGATRHFLVYGNYDVLLTYNCAHAYALSVAMLGDAVAGSGPVATAVTPGAKSKARPARRSPARGAAPPRGASRTTVSATVNRPAKDVNPAKRKVSRRRPRRAHRAPDVGRAGKPRRALAQRPGHRSPEARRQAPPAAPPAGSHDVPAPPIPVPPAPSRLQPGVVVRVSDVR